MEGDWKLSTTDKRTMSLHFNINVLIFRLKILDFNGIFIIILCHDRPMALNGEWIVDSLPTLSRSFVFKRAISIMSNCDG